MTTTFSIATAEEVWWQGRLAERRLSYGRVEEADDVLVASDVPDDALVAAASSSLERMRSLVTPQERVRLVAAASPDGVTSTIVVTAGLRSVVTTPDHFADDLLLLRSTAHDVFAPLPSRRRLPLLWKNGSASVLLHEAAGHPLEHGQPPLPLPSWLTVDVALEMRRASFSDVPLLRMKELVARQHDAPFNVPDERVDVLLIDGGAYDPLTEMVTLRIAAADLVEGEEVLHLPPFELVESRSSIARSLAGAAGEAERYPGVICSREGQELVVDSFAPLLLTDHR